MMTGRERMKRALRMEASDRVPRTLWALPGVIHHRAQELAAMKARFPMDVAPPDFRYGDTGRACGDYLRVGTYTDAWGVTWETGEAGVVGEVRHPTLATAEAMDAYCLPWEMLDKADFSRVDAGCAATDAYVLAVSEVRPFERLQFLHGTEATLVDLAEESSALLGLLARLHEFHLRDLALWASTAVDGVAFMDDWGSQNALLISPQMWRERFKPLYAEYCRLLHRAGKAVFFHSDGNISAIYPDLIEVGVDAVNSQLFCMDIEALGAAHGGRITFWGEMDRQFLLPFGTPGQVKEGVRRVRRALDHGTGGVIAQCEWGLKDPAENVAAVFEAWDESRPA